jgi:hypothetical protein
MVRSMRHRAHYAICLLPCIALAASHAACSSTDEAAAPVDASTGDDAGPDVSVPTPEASIDAPAALPTGKLVIGMWCGPPLAELKKARFEEIAAAGFTHVSNPCEGSSNVPAFNTQMLDLAGQTGLSAIVSDERAAQALGAAPADRAAKLAAVVADYGKSPALFGYHLVDEPSVPAFGAIATVVGDMRALDPSHPAIVNLLPIYASPGQLGAPTYDAYVGSFLQTVKPAVYSYDHYNFYSGGVDGADFFDNLAVFRAQSVAAKVPFWQYIQSISYNGHRDTTGPEKRWAALHTLAYGGAGVMYFTYWTPPQTAENFGSGIIAADGTKTAQYADEQAINKTLAAMGKYLAPATSTGVFHNGVLASSTVPRVPGAPVYVASAAPITVGLFTVAQDTYALLVNRSYTATTEADVHVASSDGAPEVLDVTSGQFTKASVLGTDPVKGAKLHVSLAAGDGVLLHMRGVLPQGAPGAEAFVGTVRADAGALHVVDSSFGALRVRTVGWDDCPSGYILAGRDFQSNGFFLCARKDLAARTFYVGNVVADAGTQYRVQSGAATSLGAAGWDTCAAGKAIGRVFESNGFWVCLD